jgi:hypothetical protein
MGTINYQLWIKLMKALAVYDTGDSCSVVGTSLLVVIALSCEIGICVF